MNGGMIGMQFSLILHISLHLVALFRAGSREAALKYSEPRHSSFLEHQNLSNPYSLHSTRHGNEQAPIVYLAGVPRLFRTFTSSLR